MSIWPCEYLKTTFLLANIYFFADDKVANSCILDFMNFMRSEKTAFEIAFDSLRNDNKRKEITALRVFDDQISLQQSEPGTPSIRNPTRLEQNED